MSFITLQKEHFLDVAKIYQEGINTGLATFETEIPNWEKWDSSHLQIGRIGFEVNDKIVGWASLLPTSTRKVYSGVAEISVYVAEKERRKGIGKTLVNELIRISEVHGIWTLQVSIMERNKMSIKMHEDCGFRVIGFREKVGKLNGVWLNNTILERRSKIVGI